MAGQSIETRGHPRLAAAFNAAWDWLVRLRAGIGPGSLAQASDKDIERIAHDMGMTGEELLEYDRSTIDRSEKQKRLLDALHIDPEKIQPELAADMNRMCGNCGHKTRCEYHLSLGDAPETFKDFCANASELEKLAAPPSKLSGSKPAA